MVGVVFAGHLPPPDRRRTPGRVGDPHRRRRVAPLAAALVVAGTLTGCSGEVLDDRVRVAGSESLRSYLSAASGVFLTEQTSAEVRLELTGTGDGLTSLCDGLVDLAAASRPMNERERRACEQSGVEPVELPVALDAVAVVTAADTGPNCLTPAQLYAAAGPESTGVVDWRTAQLLALGVEPTTPPLAQADAGAPLGVIAPRAGSGTVDTFLTFAVEPVAEARGNSTELRADVVTSPSSGLTITEAIAGPAQLGIVGFAELATTDERARAVAVDVGGTCVAPSATTIADGTYPIQRELVLYVDRTVAATNPTAARLVDLITSDQGQEIAERVGVVRLPADRLAETRSAWTPISS